MVIGYKYGAYVIRSSLIIFSNIKRLLTDMEYQARAHVDIRIGSVPNHMTVLDTWWTDGNGALTTARKPGLGPGEPPLDCRSIRGVCILAKFEQNKGNNIAKLFQIC